MGIINVEVYDATSRVLGSRDLDGAIAFAACCDNILRGVVGVVFG